MFFRQLNASVSICLHCLRRALKNQFQIQGEREREWERVCVCEREGEEWVSVRACVRACVFVSVCVRYIYWQKKRDRESHWQRECVSSCVCVYVIYIYIYIYIVREREREGGRTAGTFSQEKKVLFKYMCTHSYRHMHVCIYINIYIYVCIYRCTYVDTWYIANTLTVITMHTKIYFGRCLFVV